MRKYPLLAVIGAVLSLASARAAVPPGQGCYAVNLGIQPYGAPTFVCGQMLMYLDPTDTSVNAFGLPRPVSPTSPLPVTIIGGGGGSVTQGTSPWVDNITQIGGVAINLGQTTRSGSLPVTIASDQGALTATLAAGSNLAGGFNLYVNGSANASGNPAFAQLTAGAATIGAVTAPGGGALATAANQLTQSTPTDTTTAISTTSTNFGSPGSYHAVTIQAQGQPMCVTFGSGTPTAPSAGGVCAVGMYLPAGAGYTYPATVTPSSQGKAAALATGGSIWESVQ